MEWGGIFGGDKRLVIDREGSLSAVNRFSRVGVAVGATCAPPKAMRLDLADAMALFVLWGMS